MQWAALAIVAIAVVVWVLSTVFGGQNPPPAPPLRRRPERFDNPPPQRRPPIRVARPVDESRRREPPVRRPTQPEPKRPIIVLEEVKEPQTSLEATRAGYTPTQSPSKRPVEKSFPAPSSLVPAQPQTSLEATRAEYTPTQSPSLPPVVEVAKPQSTSPTLRQVREMLRSPQSAAAAFVLREIFDAPRCRRPR